MSTTAHARRLLLIVAVLLATALFGVAPPPTAGAQPDRPLRAVVLRGGDATSDAAVVQALEAHGFTVDARAETASFQANRQELGAADLLVILANTSSATRLTRGAAAEIARYVEKGGSLLVGQWSLLDPQIQPILPATHCGSNVASSTSYSRAVPNPTLNEGVPASFPLSLSPLNGNEGCLEAKDEAAVLYLSSNGGGRRNADAMVAWNVGKGRVAAFSNLLGAAELQSASFRSLFQNTAAWLATFRDTTPPRIKSFEVAGAGGIVAQREVQITISANDAGGAGLGGFFIREFGFSGNLNNGWIEEAATSGWRPLQPPGATFTWTLSPKPGVRYLQAFVSDRAGNVTPAAAVALVNYRPANSSIGLDGLHIYRVTPGAGTQTTVRLDVTAGNPDLYVFKLPEGTLVGKEEDDDTVDTVAYTALAGLYQIEVAGHTAGSYTLAYTTVRPDDAGTVKPGDDEHAFERRPRISVSSITPPQPPEEPGTLPPPAVDPEASALLEEVFLPLLRRP